MFTLTLDTTHSIYADTVQLDPNAPPASQGGSDSDLAVPIAGFRGTFLDHITNVINPVIDGVVDQAAPAKINIIDTRRPGSPVVGSGTTDAAGNCAITIGVGFYKNDGSTDLGQPKQGLKSMCFMARLQVGADCLTQIWSGRPSGPGLVLRIEEPEHEPGRAFAGPRFGDMSGGRNGDIA